MEALGRALHVLGLLELVRLADCDIGEDNVRDGSLVRGAAVVGALGDRVGKVHALAEHVAGDGRLGRCDAQTLREDTDKVGQARAVPQQHVVGNRAALGFEPIALAIAMQPCG